MNTLEYLRSFRISEYALFDILLSLFGMYLLTPFLERLFLKLGFIIPKINWLYLALPIGILVHLVTGNITKMTANFFNPTGSYILKIVIIVLIYLGTRGIKRV